jgi:hypothetical protein
MHDFDDALSCAVLWQLPSNPTANHSMLHTKYRKSGVKRVSLGGIGDRGDEK